MTDTIAVLLLGLILACVLAFGLAQEVGRPSDCTSMEVRHER